MTDRQLIQLAKQCLHKNFGFADFRPGQLDIVLSILKKQNTLAILPTGGGKSICFQVPGLIFPGLSIIISPLISLMKDQVDHLLAKNISATFINSQLKKNIIEQRLDALANNQYKFLYLAPERLTNEQIINLCKKINVSMICVDEAHCISMWAHQFRPAYKKIPEFLEKIKNNNEKIVISAFTATATSLVKKETARQTIQDQFLSGQLQIMIATNAFGMGVDKADVHLVVHYQVPANLENYYQEAGRAGRDGQLSYCYLLYADKDLFIQKTLLDKNYLNQQENPRYPIELQKLKTMRHYALSKTCLEKDIEAYFTNPQTTKNTANRKKSQSTKKNCHHCYLCLNLHLYLDQEELNTIQQLLKTNQILTKKLSEKFSIFNQQAFLLPCVLHLQSIEALAIAEQKIENKSIVPGIGTGLSTISNQLKF